MPRLGGALDIVQVSDPTTPSTGRQFLYFKNDGQLYTKKPDGSIVKVSADTNPKTFIDGGATPTEAYDTAPPSDGLYAAPVHTHPYLGVTAKAADSDKLDGLDSTAFAMASDVATSLAGKLGLTAKAADSDLLDGIDSTGFLRTGVNPTTLDPTTLPQSYPQGMSYGYFAGNGPDSTFGHAITIRNNADVNQIFFAVFASVGGVVNRIYQRTATGAGNSWNPWVLGGGGDTGWHTVGAAGEPAFQNSHVSYSDPNYGVPQFRKMSNGLVTMRGLVTLSATPAAVIFTLPVGYRPLKHWIFAGLVNSAPVDLRVGMDGNVWISTGGISGAWASIACTFMAEQ